MNISLRKSITVAAATMAIALGCGAIANAQTVSIQQLMAQIQALQAQLQQQLAQQTPTARATAGSANTFGSQGTPNNDATQACYTFTDYLIPGSVANSSAQVSALQTVLNVSGDTSGVFGTNTEIALVQFQGTHGISQTGTTGPQTRRALNAIYGCATQRATAGSANTFNSGVAQPVIGSVSPLFIYPGSTVTINGSNIHGGLVTLTNSTNDVTTANPSNLTLNGTSETFVVPQNIIPGNYSVQILVESGTGAILAQSSQVPITIFTATQPTITSITPTTGTGGTPVTINGSNFFVNGSINFSQNGSVVATMTLSVADTYVLAVRTNQILFTLDPTIVANINPGVYQISISNSNGTSNSEGFTITSSATTNPLIGVINSVYPNQTISANSTKIKVGSYVFQNQSTTDTVKVNSYSIATTTSGTTINNFSSLQTSDTTGAGSTPIQFSGSGTTSTDMFSVNRTLAPGASMTLDVFANTSGATSGTIQTALTISSTDITTNTSTTTGPISGQLLTLNGSQSPTNEQQNLFINNQSSNGPVTVSGAATLTWSSSNATSCVASSCLASNTLPITGICPAGNAADPLWYGPIAASGTKTGSAVTKPIIYSLICWDASGNGTNNSLGATPTTSTQPTIAFASPSVGSTWAAGSTQNIMWYNTGVNILSIALYNPLSSTSTLIIATNLPGGTGPSSTYGGSGSYSWTLPSTLTPGQYLIVISDRDAGETNVEASAPITITAPATTSSCTPNWSCIPWSACLGTQQIRACVDTNKCGTNAGMPASSQACVMANPLSTSCSPTGQCVIGGGGTACTSAAQCSGTSSSCVSGAGCQTNANGVYTVSCSGNVTQCSSGQTCQNTYATSLSSNGSVAQTISGGQCTTAASTQTCTPAAALKCVGNSVYNFDSCGNQQTLIQNCTSNQTCSSGACITSTNTAPILSITSPAGGEQWQAGSTHNITWTQSGFQSIKILFISSNGNQQNVTLGTPASPGSYSWQIPTTIAAGTYTISVSGVALNQSATSNSFTITAPTAATCTPNWQTGAWSACQSGVQSRSVTDANNCGSAANKPATIQSCASTSQPTVTSFSSIPQNISVASGSSVTLSWNFPSNLKFCDTGNTQAQWDTNSNPASSHAVTGPSGSATFKPTTTGTYGIECGAAAGAPTAAEYVGVTVTAPVSLLNSIAGQLASLSAALQQLVNLTK
jgi:hypothetical protein